MNIALTGFMGTGKSVIGKKLARKLKMDFCDVDLLIEARKDMRVWEIFAAYGEERFREIETRIIEEVSDRKECVISCGGGVVLNPKNIEFLRKNSLIVNLFADPAAILKRVKGDHNRPVLEGPFPTKTKIKALLASRHAAYSNCDFALDTTRITTSQAAIAISIFYRRFFVKPIKRKKRKPAPSKKSAPKRRKI
ncbi:MAG: shikimate kinase [Elusimicrobiota bacterium]|jgi:shikimate kinase|nr:shikimate kinase [Elusimicrobiota bacterium]